MLSSKEGPEEIEKDEHRDTEDTTVHRGRLYGWKKQKLNYKMHKDTQNAQKEVKWFKRPDP